MAIPPDPIDTVLPGAAAAVLAKVAKVVSQDPQKPFPKVPEGTADAPGEVARQVVALSVSEVLFGGAAGVRAGETFDAEKPAGDYALSAGNGGPFLLAQRDATKGGPRFTILGRYGPDTYPAELIKARLGKHGKK